MIPFLTPALLTNGLPTAASFIFLNADIEYCLYQNCETMLDSEHNYNPKDNGGPEAFGLYFPVVGSQSELLLNYGMFSASGFSDLYIWFQPGEGSEHILTTGSSLSFGEGYPVMMGETPVKASTVAGTHLAMGVLDGGTIIIVGVIDSEDENDNY